MKRLNLIVVALALLALTLAPAVASAAERHQWYGRDADGDRYSFGNTAGEDWTGTFTGNGKTDSAPYKEVTRTEDFVELQLDGNKDARVRLYKDKLYFWSKSSGKWVEMCKG